MLADLMRWNGGKTKRTYDVQDATVVAQPYSTSGNGGRKLVRLSNGWLVAGVYSSSNNTVYFYVDKQDGVGFQQAFYLDIATTSPIIDYSIVAKDNLLMILSSFGATNYAKAVQVRVVDVPNQTNVSIANYSSILYGYSLDNTQTVLGKVSLAINPQGTELHAAWSSKNATYPNSFNIRYAKGTINGDGSVTWGAVEQLTTANLANENMNNPSVSVVNNSPCVLYDAKFSSGNFFIHALVQDGATFSRKTVYNGGTYGQSSPSAVVDKDGVIHVAWHGADATEVTPRIRYSRSIDGGVTWSAMVLVSTNPNRLSPSISVDSLNKVFVSSNWSTTSVNTFELSGSTWTLVKTTTSATNPSLLYDPTFSLEFSNPPRIYMGTAGNVSFTGTWTE